MVIWLTGLSGVGKTTIGRHIFKLWKATAPNTVLVDGDTVRHLVRFNTTEDAYSMAGRHAAASRYCDICAWLDSQDINVVCCTISFFEDLRERNRRNLSGYFEVHVSAPLEVLRRRDRKNLYERALRGKIKNVVGVDQVLAAPIDPDMTVDNSADRADFADIAGDILNRALASRPGRGAKN